MYDHDRQSQFPGGRQFGRGGRAAAVLGDQDVDAVVAQEGRFGLHRERAARQQDFRVARHRRLGRFHRAYEVVQFGFPGEGRETQAARREEDAPAQGREQVGGFGEGRRRVPAVAGDGGPARAAQDDGRDTGGRRGPCRVLGDARGEGVCGVDDGVHVLGAQPLREALRPAEPSDAYVPVQGPRPGDAARERRGHAHAGAGRERRGQFTRLGGPAEDQDMRRHGVERTGPGSFADPPACRSAGPASLPGTVSPGPGRG